MPTDAADFYCTVHKHGTATFLARVVGPSGAPLAPAEIAAGSYSLYLLDDREPDVRTSVSGHDQVALAVADVVRPALQTDAHWTRDTLGYNFRHTLDIWTDPAFTIAGRQYLLEYRLVPPTGQVILLRFRIHVI